MVQFLEKCVEHKSVSLFSLQLLPETFIIVRRIQRDIIINILTSSSKVPIIVRFLSHLNFLDRFSRNTECKISWKTVLWELNCLMWADRWTDMTKLIMSLVCSISVHQMTIQSPQYNQQIHICELYLSYVVHYQHVANHCCSHQQGNLHDYKRSNVCIIQLCIVCIINCARVLVIM
jgi:hypothetical protein